MGAFQLYGNGWKASPAAPHKFSDPDSTLLKMHAHDGMVPCQHKFGTQHALQLTFGVNRAIALLGLLFLFFLALTLDTCSKNLCVLIASPGAKVCSRVLW